jgi:transcriptional regulator
VSVYVPRHFAEQDAAAIRRVLDEFGFATLVTVADGEPVLSHVPVLVEYDDGRPVAVIGHVAAANPHAKALAAASSLLVFQGPHGYVSPNWYEAPDKSVPTWNYVAVHLAGPLTRIDALDGKRAIVDALSARHEAAFPQPWTTGKMEPSLLEKMLGGIVGFRMTVERVEAKFKLTQNRSAADRARVVAALEARNQPSTAELAAWMRPYVDR